MKQYQTGIQKFVLEIIKLSKKNDLNFTYISKQQIITEIRNTKPEIIDVNNKVGQALYQLQRKTKFRKQRIKKYYDDKGKYLGWTLTDDKLYEKS